MHLLRCGFLIVAGVVAAASTTSAQSTILKTRKSASSTWSPILPLSLGIGLEYETDSDHTEYNFPLQAEYNFTQFLKLHVEPDITSIHGKSAAVNTVSGLGDTETAVEYEFLHERRYTPALTAEGVIRWPTASDPDLGSPGADYSVGLFASKDCVKFELDSNLLYTYSGDPDVPDNLELSLAVDYPLSHFFDIEAEVVHTFDIGQVPSVGGVSGTEATLAYAWHITPFQTLEQGVVVKDDGSWQLLLGWLYSFGGD